MGDILDFVDVSVSIYASAPLSAGITMIYPSSQCKGRAPAELEGFYGLSDLTFGVSVSFVGKRLGLSLNTGFSRMKWSR